MLSSISVVLHHLCIPLHHVLQQYWYSMLSKQAAAETNQRLFVASWLSKDMQELL